MRHNEMTIEEFLAWKSGDFDEYKKLLTRWHWLGSRIRGAGERQLEYEDSMSVFADDEHDDPAYLRWKDKHDKETATLEKLTAEKKEIESELSKYMTKGGKGKPIFH